MKIIIISPFPPYPPDSGGRIRQWELIKCLSRKHDLTLAFFINKGDEKILDGAFEGICSRVAMITHAGDNPKDAVVMREGELGAAEGDFGQRTSR